LGWQIAMNAKMGFKLQVTATLRFHCLYDWWHWTLWLLSGVPEDPEDDTVMEQHGADARNSAVMSLMHGIGTEDQEAQHDAAHRMIQIAKCWTI